jgi:hypothetical protein
MDRTIKTIWFNWFAPNTYGGEEYSTYTVGEKRPGAPDRTVTAILEHWPMGEGDRWYYDVEFDNGDMERIFHPHQVKFEPIPPTAPQGGS